MWSGGVSSAPHIHRWDRQDAGYEDEKDHLNLRNPLTAVGEHCVHEHHKITKDSVRVLAREDIWLKGKVREASKIKIRQPAITRDQGVRAPPAVMWSSSRRSHDLGGLVRRPDEVSEVPAKAFHQAK